MKGSFSVSVCLLLPRVSQLERIPVCIFFSQRCFVTSYYTNMCFAIKGMYVVLQNYEILLHQKQLCHIHLKGNAISIILFVSVKERFSNKICVKNNTYGFSLFFKSIANSFIPALQCISITL